MASIKKNFFYNILLNVSNVLFPLITAPYIARVLEPDGVGLYNFAVGYADYFALFACLGIPTYGMREIAKKRSSDTDRDTTVSELLSINILSSLVVSVIFVLSVFFVPQLSENKILFLLAGFLIYLAPLNVDWFFLGMERFRFIATRKMLVRCITIVCMFIFVKTKSDLIYYLLIYVANQIAGNLLAFTMMSRSGVRFKVNLANPKILRHFRPMLILFSSAVAMSIYTMLDTLMLGFMSTYTEVGYYTTATHVSKAIVMVVTSLAGVVIPRVSYLMEQNDIKQINDLTQKTISAISFIAFPIAIGLACVSYYFVPLFFGQEFYGAIVPLAIMAFVILAIGFNNLIGMQILIGMGHDKPYLKSILTGTVINLIFNIFLIPLLGASGAAISSVLAETVILFVMVHYVHKCTPVKFHSSLPEIFKALAVSLLFVPLIYLLSRYIGGWWLVAIFVTSGAAIYIPCLWLMGHRSFELVKPHLDRFLRR